jgi:hypothetical protein
MNSSISSWTKVLAVATGVNCRGSDFGLTMRSMHALPCWCFQLGVPHRSFEILSNTALTISLSEGQAGQDGQGHEGCLQEEEGKQQ